MKFLLPLIFIAACSTTQEKPKQAPETITNEAFKKERALNNSEVADFYQGNMKALSPALQDETLDRYTDSELKTINTSGDQLLQISVMCSRGQYKDAFKVASQSFDKYQKVAPYWNLVANCHLNAGSHRKALLFYNKALEISKNYVPALNNIGVMYSRQGQDQKALVAFERASKEGKFSKTPRYNLARLYLTYGLAEKALPIFEGLLNEAPQDVDILSATGSAYFLTGDYQRAVSYFRRIPQSEWRRPEIGLNLAWTLKLTGDDKTAKQVFGLVSKPGNSELRRYYDVVSNQLGDKK
jgi:tetratricopeptide (TPR) repeat protein